MTKSETKKQETAAKGKQKGNANISKKQDALFPPDKQDNFTTTKKRSDVITLLIMPSWVLSLL